MRKPRIDTEKFKQLAPQMTALKLSQTFGITERQVRHYLHVFQLKAKKPDHWIPWDALEDQLREAGKIMCKRDMAKAFGLSTTQLRYICKRRGIETLPDLRTPAWIPEHVSIEDLAEMAKTQTCQQMAEHFGATVSQVRQYLGRRGIKAKITLKHHFSIIGQHGETVKSLATEMTVPEIAAATGLTVKTVRYLCSRLKVKAKPMIAAPAPKPEKKAKPKAAKQPKPTIQQTKKWEPPVKQPVQIIWPEGVKITRIVSSKGVFGRPIYTPTPTSTTRF